MPGLDDISQHSRSLHRDSCPCKLCVAYDIELAYQEGTIKRGVWRPGMLEAYVTDRRGRDLNWDLPTGHCLLCAGNVLHSYLVGQHYQRNRWNEKVVDGKWYTSLLIHRLGWQVGAYKDILVKRLKVIDWACQLMDLSTSTCIGVAAREHEEWIEIRLGFTELITETYDQRIERYYRECSGVGAVAQGASGAIQGPASVA